MKQDQEQKCHVCRFCKESFLNGKQLGGHMRRHLALISACKKMGIKETINGEKGLDDSRDDDDVDQMLKNKGINQDYDTICKKQSMQEDDQGIINDEMGLDFDDVMIKKSQNEMGDSRANVYVLRENPKRSWRVSNSSKDFDKFCKKRCQSRKESFTDSVCDKCGKSFNSMKALYGHMRCHSIKRSQPFDESFVMSSSYEHHDEDGDDDDDGGGGVATAVRKKRSYTRYKSPKPNHHSTSLSSSDDEVERGAICLMMLSRGVRNLDEVKLVISNQAEFAFSDSGYEQTLQSDVVFEVSVDGSMECCKLKTKSKMGLKKDLIFESRSGQLNPGKDRSTFLKKYKSPKKPRSCDQDFGEMDAIDSGISLKLKNKSKLSLKKDLIFESGSGQLNPGQTQSTTVNYKSPKKPRSCDQDFGDVDAADSDISLELKRSKEHSCPICFKKFRSGQALGSHKRVHASTERKVTESNHIPDVHRLVNPESDFLRKVSTMGSS